MTNDLRFLESTDNIKRALIRATGRTPNAGVCRSVAVCLQQGRMYFEAADGAPIEIRPLLVFYGMMAFAKAIITGRSLRDLSTLNQAHGLSDISDHGTRIANLRVKVDGRGTFQDFNDIVCKHEGLNYFERAMTHVVSLPTATSAEIDQVELTLREILSRTPGLEDLYRDTFGEEPNAMQFMLHTNETRDSYTELRVDPRELYEDRASVGRLLGDLRAKYPMLRLWGFETAAKAWGRSILILTNKKTREEEFDPSALVEHGTSGFQYQRGSQMHEGIDFRTLLLPVAGGRASGNPYLVSPIGERYVADPCLKYAGMYLLSSLVRYRPQVWVHSVSRLVTQDRPADDAALALVERFMGSAVDTFTGLTYRLLTEP